MKQAFAQYSKVKDELAEMGLTKDIFWNKFKERVGVDSRADVRMEQWKALTDDLVSGNFAEWIYDIITKMHRADSESDSDMQTELDEIFEGGKEMSPQMKAMLGHDEPPTPTPEDTSEAKRE